MTAPQADPTVPPGSPPSTNVEVASDASSSGNMMKEQELETNAKPSPPQSLFKFEKSKDKEPASTWNRQIAENKQYIQIVVEREGFANGAVIADRVDSSLLFKMAPALQKQPLEDNRMFVPNVACLDEDTVSSLVYDLVLCAQKGLQVPPNLLDEKFIPMIKIHCVFVLFEMKDEATNLLEKLWTMFGTVQLQTEDVLWIWDTFGAPFRNSTYIAPFAEEYVQMMAWQVLNLDAEKNLNEGIRSLIVWERDPKYFTQMILARRATYGLSRDPLDPQEPQNSDLDLVLTTPKLPKMPERPFGAPEPDQIAHKEQGISKFNFNRASEPIGTVTRPASDTNVTLKDVESKGAEMTEDGPVEEELLTSRTSPSFDPRVTRHAEFASRLQDETPAQFSIAPSIEAGHNPWQIAPFMAATPPAQMGFDFNAQQQTQQPEFGSPFRTPFGTPFGASQPNTSNMFNFNTGSGASASSASGGGMRRFTSSKRRR